MYIPFSMYLKFANKFRNLKVFYGSLILIHKTLSNRQKLKNRVTVNNFANNFICVKCPSVIKALPSLISASKLLNFGKMKRFKVSSIMAEKFKLNEFSKFIKKLHK